MNADWRSPVQPDHLESDVKQDTNYPQFLKEQDAMDNMLWGDVAISPTNPWSDSQDITYFERGSIMDLGCVCNYFPPLYCARHGIDFDTFKDNDMPLPSFDPGQTITHSDDVLESVEAAPGHLELTEESLTGQSLFQSFQNPFEMGQDDPGISTNDRDIPTPKYLDAHLSPRPPRQNRSGRSKIPPRDKRILKAHFARNPYPTDSELDELHKRTSLAIKCIKTWFNNFRHRTAPHRSLIIRSPPETPKRDMSETPSQASTSVSAESLRRLDRASPAQSTSSLERYLATPLIEEAIPSAAIKPLMEASIMSKHDVVLERKRNMRQGNLERRFNADAERRFRADAERQFNETLQRKGFKTKAIRSTLRRTGGAGSVAGSDSSMDSGSSVGSWTSQNSADSRGSRKGRKSWVQAPNHITAASPSSKDPPPFEIPIAI
ncbi:hypothetical protein J4E85_002573 [Alternaria conjuncta]|uniref:uncharacterized protein n=1 Tax=Alternaria conjuncta TaxID=181017 RepID=UPI00222084F4|nr:uncharacterized protein J4E85_002573 [Alternaria conjuncta]KAI4934715.1 hypothetical protein J4E85_002573 [Alternaria conjuncta]